MGSDGKMKGQIDYFVYHVFEYGMNRLEAQIKQNLAGLGHEC